MLNKNDLFQYDELAYNEQFEIILEGIVAAYRLMLKDCSVIQNNENTIRNFLHEYYLSNEYFKKSHQLVPFHFEAEPAVIKKLKEKGFIDIKIIIPNTFFVPNAYFTIECKRLDGEYRDKRRKNNPPLRKNSLAVEYVKNGILRFVEGKYPNSLGVNGMIAFIVQKTDIEATINDINSLLEQQRFKNTNTRQLLTKYDLIDSFDDAYLSVHEDKNGNLFELYHLMLDLSSIVSS